VRGGDESALSQCDGDERREGDAAKQDIEQDGLKTDDWPA
jgi:hypothetical protein